MIVCAVKDKFWSEMSHQTFVEWLMSYVWTESEICRNYLPRLARDKCYAVSDALVQMKQHLCSVSIAGDLNEPPNLKVN